MEAVNFSLQPPNEGKGLIFLCNVAFHMEKFRLGFSKLENLPDFGVQAAPWTKSLMPASSIKINALKTR